MLSLATSLTSHACLNVERRRENLDHIPMGSPPSDRPSWASLYASASQRFIEEVASISFSVKLGNFVKFATFDNAWKQRSEPICRPRQARASSTSFPQIGSHWKKVQLQLVSSFRSDQAKHKQINWRHQMFRSVFFLSFHTAGWLGLFWAALTPANAPTCGENYWETTSEVWNGHAQAEPMVKCIPWCCLKLVLILYTYMSRSHICKISIIVIFQACKQKSMSELICWFTCIAYMWWCQLPRRCPTSMSKRSPNTSRFTQ